MKKWRLKESTKSNIKCFISGTAISVLVLFAYQTFIAPQYNFGVKMRQITKVLDSYYIEDYDKKEFMEYLYMAGMTYFEDPYTVYFPKQDYQAFNKTIEGAYSGIGVEIGGNEIKNIFPNTPAEKAGLKVGDTIIKINGVKLEKQEEIVNFIRESKKKSFEMLVERDGQEHTFTVERQKISIPVIETEANVEISEDLTYIKLVQFNHQTFTNLKEAIDNHPQQKGLILDLRDNMGGFLDETQKILQYFCSKDDVVFYEKKKDKLIPYYGAGEKVEIPIVILVNENTASAAEVMALALKENNGAILIGETTFGKGVIQGMFSFPDGSGLKVTIAEWLGPNKKSINHEGIEPDYKISDFPEQIQKAEELLLEGKK